MIEYIKLFWAGAPEGEPSVILYEVDTENEWLVLRSIDIFADGRTRNIPDLYEGAIEITPIPTVEELNAHIWGEEFRACAIEKAEFEAGGHMYVVAGAATLLTLFALEVLTLFFGRLGRRRIMVVFSAADRKAIDAMFNELQSSEYAVISYEVEAQRSPDGVVYRATLVIRAKGNADEERYVDLLRENPDVTVERIV